jgi:hypothetical protein
MNSVKLGAIGIIQNVTTPNEDVYTIQVGTIKGIVDKQALYDLLTNEVGNPERFVIQQVGSDWNVYTKQPDAAVELALFMNQKKDVQVNEQETESIRNQLIRLQKV